MHGAARSVIMYCSMYTVVIHCFNHDDVPPPCHLPFFILIYYSTYYYILLFIKMYNDVSLLPKVTTFRETLFSIVSFET